MYYILWEHNELLRERSVKPLLTMPSAYISHGQLVDHHCSTDSHTVKCLIVSSITCLQTLTHPRIAVLGFMTHSIVQTLL
jgi:hypothetical protein